MFQKFRVFRDLWILRVFRFLWILLIFWKFRAFRELFSYFFLVSMTQSAG